MKTANQARLTRALSTLTGAAVDHVDAQAKKSAAALIAQGWTDNGDDYEIGNFSGDVEALADRLGYAPRREQVNALERCVRVCLDDAAA